MAVRILSSFKFAAGAKNLERVDYASIDRANPVHSFRLLGLIWKHRHRAGVLLIEGVVPQMWPAILQSYLPGCRLKIVVTECLWEYSPRNARGRLKLWLMQRMIRRFDRCILYAKVDVMRFANYFEAPASKFSIVRHHETLHPGRFPLRTVQGGYIFSGGNSDRDYAPLLEAVADLDCLCVIACSAETLQGLKLPANAVRVQANPHQFRQLLEGAKLVVVPMRTGMLRSAGQQTLVNAMKLGKPVVVTDIEGASDYIQNGVTGILVQSDQIRSKLEELLRDPERARTMGDCASKAVAELTIEGMYDTICSIADQVASISTS